VFGAWCAKFLADAGHQVWLVDAYGPANGRASSADYSRVIRAGYGNDIVYSQWATASLRDWQWLAETTGQGLLARTGALFLGEPANDYVRATFETLSRLELGPLWLEPCDLAARFPHIATDGLGPAVLEPHAGVIRARAAVHALVGRLVAESGVTLVLEHVLPADEQQGSCEVRTAAGRVVQADGFVFACGPWLPKLFPQAIGPRIRATRQEVLYFGVPAGDGRFSAANLPVWIDFAAGVYGIPDLDAAGFKIGIDRHGPIIDPDTLDRRVGDELVAETRGWMAQRFPGLAGAPLVDARVCQYENTASGDFILDRHPQWTNCWIAGGGSGHGFKHGPAIGRAVARLVDTEQALEPRFALSTKSTVAARAVY
jgi:glycine/D-amino acid oxidase-like deaminating enzyme